MKKIFDEAGEAEYQRYYGAIIHARKTRLMKSIKENFSYLSKKEKRILKNKYVLKMKEADAAKAAGYSGVAITGNIRRKLKILAGEHNETRERLVEHITKTRELEDFIKAAKNDERAEQFLSKLTKKRADIFRRYYFSNETAVDIAESYNCFRTSIESIAQIVLSNLREFLSADDERKAEILNSLQRTKNQGLETIYLPMKKIVREFIALENYEQLLKKFPERDQFIIKNYMVLGKTGQKIQKAVELTKEGLVRRAQILCKKMEVFVYGTEPEKERALQLLNNYFWREHKVNDNIREFMQQENYEQIKKKFPMTDQTILEKYFIQGQPSIDVAKKIGLGKSGLYYRADLISKRINILLKGTPEEQAACLSVIERDKKRMDKKTVKAKAK